MGKSDIQRAGTSDCDPQSLIHNPVSFFESRLAAALGTFSAGTVFLAAVSGGADSTAMLAALVELRREAGYVLHCVHVEHGIRPAAESRGDERAVEALCEKLKVPLRVISIPQGSIAAFAGNGGPGIEAAARIFRLRALHREGRRVGANRILTAHTRDDLLETLLMRVLRGSGPAGFGGIKASRGRLLRPLLDLTRQDVLNYLKAKDLPYQTDSTNADIRFLRNRIRLKLVPLLNEYFPSWRSGLAAFAETQSLCAEFIGSEMRARLPWEEFLGDYASGGAGSGAILKQRATEFMKAPSILREEAVFAGADIIAAGHRNSLRHIAVPRRAAVRRAVKGDAASAEDLGPVRLGRRNGFIELTAASKSRGERGFLLLIKEAGFYILKGKVLEGKVSGSRTITDLSVGVTAKELAHAAQDAPRSDTGENSAAGASCFCAGLPLVLRNHLSGDRIFRGGHRRRFSDILDRSVLSGYTVIITAVDVLGPAAFIGIGRRGDLVVMGRDAPKTDSLETGAAGAAYFFVVSVQ